MTEQMDATRVLWISLNHNPSPSLILAARYLVMEVDKTLLPAWVFVLAEGKLNDWPATYEKLMEYKCIVNHIKKSEVQPCQPG